MTNRLPWEIRDKIDRCLTRLIDALKHFNFHNLSNKEAEVVKYIAQGLDFLDEARIKMAVLSRQINKTEKNLRMAREAWRATTLQSFEDFSTLFDSDLETTYLPSEVQTSLTVKEEAS